MPRPTLYIFVGYPGAGKTTAAQIIAEATGAVHLWADQERRQRFGKPTHSFEESTQLYEELNNKTASLLSEGKSVIFDTNFNFYGDRQKLRRIAEQNGAATVLLWITTPSPTAKNRALGETAPVRNGYPMHMSEDEFNAIASKLETPTPEESPLTIDGSNIDEGELLRLLGLQN